MKCEDIQDLLGVYFDLPEEDDRRCQMDLHMKDCEACREEFEIWQESTHLIRQAKLEEVPVIATAAPVSSQVMKRIYADEGWRIPVTDRIYSIPYRTRRNLTAFIAFCLALFLCSFLLHFTGTGGALTEASSRYGIKQAAKVADSPADSLNVHTMKRTTLVSAAPALIDPVKLGPIRTVPDYMLTLSILGLISTLLIMNWLSRTRA